MASVGGVPVEGVKALLIPATRGGAGTDHRVPDARVHGGRWSVTGVGGNAHVQMTATEVSSHVRVSVEAGRSGMSPLARGPPKGGIR